LYSRGGIFGGDKDGDSDVRDGIDGDELKIDLVLDLLSDLYSKLDSISVGVSRLFFCSTSYHLLTI